MLQQYKLTQYFSYYINTALLPQIWTSMFTTALDLYNTNHYAVLFNNQHVHTITMTNLFNNAELI